MAIYFLATNPVRLIGWIPAALTLYFFIPFVTLLTLGQTVPLLLTARAALKARLPVAVGVQPLFLFMLFVFIGSAIYAIVLGSDPGRAVIRILYYLSMFALLSFAYDMGLREDCQKIMLKGLVMLGFVLALYGIYQILAVSIGLPVRGIVRGTTGSQIALEGGMLRINSLASEPKRLGYVMFICAMACLFLAKAVPEKYIKLNWIGVVVFLLSFSTVAGSYFMALAIFGVATLLLYPFRATKYIFGVLAALLLANFLFPDSGFFQALVEGYERRAEEVEVGLDGQMVYRQEFYAWDYLSQNYTPAFFGVGLGQYFNTLYREYGVGVGLNEYSGLIPLNSTYLEMLFDLSGVLASIFYAAILLLIWRLRQAGETFLCLALLFVVIQSLTILTLPWIILFAGLGLARLAVRRTDPRGNRGVRRTSDQLLSPRD